MTFGARLFKRYIAPSTGYITIQWVNIWETHWVIHVIEIYPVHSISCGYTTDFYLGKTDLRRANSSKICLGKFISGFVLPR